MKPWRKAGGELFGTIGVAAILIHRRLTRTCAAVGLCMLFCCLWGTRALATTRYVNNLDDGGAGSLRNVIAASAAGDTINFTVSGTITLTSAQLEINKNLTISGPGPGGLAVTFSGFGRAFYISSGVVTISGLTIRDCQENYGSALYIASGAIVTLGNCVIATNKLIYDGAVFISPGCVENLGNLSLINCTFSGNQGDSGTQALDSQPGSALTINSCTFDRNNNRALRSRGTLSLNNSTFYMNGGGAINVGGSATITGCTVYRNSSFGGGISSFGDLTVRNTILANNARTYPDASGNLFRTTAGGTITSQGYNLCSDDANGLLTGPGDQVNTDPKMDPLGIGYHGGYNGTVALVAGSPAIDQGNSFGLTADQRGYPRPVDNPGVPSAPGGDGSDIGAYEAPVDALQPGGDIVVNTLADHDDGVCGVADCTLREAVARANTANSSPRITFGPGLTGTIALDRSLGELPISASMLIIGSGARTLTVSGGGYIRIFNVSPGKVVRISGLTLREGWQAGGFPGGSNQGGAIRNAGWLTLEDCTFVRNYAAGVSASAGTSVPGGAGQGGAIYNSGTLTLNRCLFSRDASGGNLAAGGAGGSNSSFLGSGGAGGAGQGGAVFNETTGTLSANNCTFYGSSAAGGAGGSGYFAANGGPGTGGAIFSLGTMTLVGCTISANAGSGGAGGTGTGGNNGIYGSAVGGIAALGGSAVFANTLCANSSASGFSVTIDVKGAFASMGYNLVGTADHSTGFNNSTDQSGTDSARIDPKLGPLQNNGGPTDTLSLLPGSPALDRGKRFELTCDQRGVLRPVDDNAIPNAFGGDGSDIGALEFVVEGPQGGPVLLVTTLDDHDDGTASYLDCTLREAINAANSLPGPNTIRFAAGVSGVVSLHSPLPDVTSDIDLQGPNWLTLNGNSNRVFSFTSGTSTVSSLNIANGQILGFDGQWVSGAGVYNQATLTLIDCELYDNRAEGGGALLTGPGGAAQGAAIYNSGALTLNRCTLWRNSAVGGHGANAGFRGGPAAGGSAVGAAIFNATGATLDMINCTISQNTATGGAGGSGGSLGANGGAGHAGVFNQGTLHLTSCTISANSGTGGPGGTGTANGVAGVASGGLAQSEGGGTNTVRNTICADNHANGSSSGSDIFGSFNSQGYNLVGSTQGGSGFGATGDQLGADPRLGPLQFGGVMPIFLDSAALDKGKSFGLTLDGQRLPRTLDSPSTINAAGGDGTDIGAFEFNPAGWDLDFDGNNDPDSDGDHMSDYFEIFYGFNPYDPSDATADPDGDGFSNYQEYVAGTDPRDPASVLRITAVQRNGNNVTVIFSPALPLRLYRLEYKNSLVDPVWNSILGVADVTPSFPGSAQISDPTAAGSSNRFYHVRVM